MREELEALLLSTSKDWTKDWSRANHFDRITDQIYCGDEEYIFSDFTYRALRAEGITHVLDARSEAHRDRQMVRPSEGSEVGIRKSSFNYFNNGCWDDGKPKSIGYFMRSIDFGVRALSDPNAKIYLHCAAGINRGPSSCYAVLRTAGGLDRISAELLLRRNRPVVRIEYLEDAERAVLRYNRITQARTKVSR